MKKRPGLLKGLVKTLAVFAVLILAGVWFFDAVDSTSGSAETELVRDAVRSAAVTCYAVEGAYPSTLDYLTEHYGLVYDEDTYLIVYDAFASNILPTIRVLERGSGWQ